jgi:hypothetical protein
MDRLSKADSYGEGIHRRVALLGTGAQISQTGLDLDELKAEDTDPATGASAGSSARGP